MSLSLEDSSNTFPLAPAAAFPRMATTFHTLTKHESIDHPPQTLVDSARNLFFVTALEKWNEQVNPTKVFVPSRLRHCEVPPSDEKAAATIAADERKERLENEEREKRFELQMMRTQAMYERLRRRQLRREELENKEEEKKEEEDDNEEDEILVA